MTRSPRDGLSLIEVLIIIGIVVVLIGLMLPATRRVQGSAARIQCQNNLKQIGIALHSYNENNKSFPSSGECLADNGNETAFNMHSTYTHLLPYLEQSDLYNQINTNLAYNDNSTYTLPSGGMIVQNQSPFQTPIPAFLCPTNPLRPKSGVDTKGYGYTDYMVISSLNLRDDTFTGGSKTDLETDLDAPNNGVVAWVDSSAADKSGSSHYAGRWPGALSANYSHNTITNGTSAPQGSTSSAYGAGGPSGSFQAPGYTYVNVATYPVAATASNSPVGAAVLGIGNWNFNPDTAPTGRLVVDTNPKSPEYGRWKKGDRGPTVGELSDGLSTTVAIVEDVGRVEELGASRDDDPFAIPGYNGQKRCAWRWAEPGSASGLSGAPNATYKSGKPSSKILNNNPQPVGGPPECKWTTTNCGPNGEPFSFHANGVNCLFMDGSVRFMRDDIDVQIFKRLCTPIEGINSGYVEQ